MHRVAVDCAIGRRNSTNWDTALHDHSSAGKNLGKKAKPFRQQVMVSGAMLAMFICNRRCRAWEHPTPSLVLRPTLQRDKSWSFRRLLGRIYMRDGQIDSCMFSQWQIGQMHSHQKWDVALTTISSWTAAYRACMLALNDFIGNISSFFMYKVSRTWLKMHLLICNKC